jgi:hypothetical protein
LSGWPSDTDSDVNRKSPIAAPQCRDAGRARRRFAPLAPCLADTVQKLEF